MQLFYAPDFCAPTHTLNADESRHAVKVLRLGRGDRLHITDGRGGLFVCEVVEPDPRGCVVTVAESFAGYGRLLYSLTMGVAPTKNSDRYEWFLEKATEVGVDAVIPIECDNSERRVVGHARAEKVIVSAMKQSLKAYLPRLQPLTKVDDVLRGADGGVDSTVFSGLKLIAHCRPDDEFPDHPRVPIMEALAAHLATTAPATAPAATPATTPAARPEILILIGPEGDFSQREVAFALENSFIPVSLGQSRLRTETAAIAAVMAVYLAKKG